MRDAAYKSVIQSRNSLLRKKVKSIEFVACYFSLGHEHILFVTVSIITLETK